jgi:hypothetical protein
MRRIAVLIVLLWLPTICVSQRPRANVDATHLLRTAWGGSKPFNAFAPNASTLGCHSVAFAQAMYFHRLAPHGKIFYECSDGTRISEDFTDYKPAWKAFALNRESAEKSASSLRETSRFIYYVAAIIRKDFGTDQYVDYPDDGHKKAIESHFHCAITAYPKEVRSDLSQALRSTPDSYAVMKAELDARRPAGFYYTDRKGGGHAVIIDGYAVKEGKTYFHVNFGWLGRSDGWYLLEEDLPKSIKEIVVITIKPRRTNETKEKGTEKS